MSDTCNMAFSTKPYRLATTEVCLHGAKYEVKYCYTRGYPGSCEDPAEQEDWGIEDIVRISTEGLSDLEIEDLEYYEHQPDFCDKIINEIEKQLKDY